MGRTRLGQVLIRWEVSGFLDKNKRAHRAGSVLTD